MPKKKKGSGHAHHAKAGNKNNTPAAEITERRLLAQKEVIEAKLAAIAAKKAGEQPAEQPEHEVERDEAMNRVTSAAEAHAAGPPPFVVEQLLVVDQHHKKCRLGKSSAYDCRMPCNEDGDWWEHTPTSERIVEDMC